MESIADIMPEAIDVLDIWMIETELRRHGVEWCYKLGAYLTRSVCGCRNWSQKQREHGHQPTHAQAQTALDRVRRKASDAA